MDENTPHDFQEPPFPVEDIQTPRETGSYPAIYPKMQTRPAWVYLLGGTGILAAIVIIGVAAFILLSADDGEKDTLPTSEPTLEQVAQQATDSPATETAPETTSDGIGNPQANIPAALPTMDSQLASSLLEVPLQNISYTQAGRVESAHLNPFTVASDRPRSEMLQYTAVRGDTIEDIAIRYNLESETIVWSNKRSILQALRPGDVINIPPGNGVFIRTVGSTRTIRDYAEEYEVDDVYTVLDHPANTSLLGLEPDSVPQSNTPIFFPGGKGPEVIWIADSRLVENTAPSGSSGSSGAGITTAQTAIFQNGHPGSCAPQSIEGLGLVWTNPVSGGYTITQGFSVSHSGIDLAGVTGTPIVAANLGRVVFSGWNTFGYGNMVALVHGSTMTVYAHMQFAPTISCGQVVNPGEVIGLMGSTGISSGPHLHFEIRSLSDSGQYIPTNPVIYMGF